MRTLTALIAFALTALLGATPAQAGDFQVNPVRLFLVIVEELPDHRTTDAQGVNIRMRMSVPIFVDAKGTVARGEVEGARVETASERQITFSIKNLGNRHFKAGPITIGLDVKGREEPLLAQLTGWYVLAGGVRLHTVVLPPEARCVTRATVGVDTDFAGRLERVMPVTDPACPR